MSVYDILRKKFVEIVALKGLGNEPVEISPWGLTPEEAIGRPEERDYVILKGKERIMRARFRGAEGDAFGDTLGTFEGNVSDVLFLDLEDNFRRAVFIATLNAVARSLGIAKRTVHCRDDGPRRCAAGLADYLHTSGYFRKVALFGLQPRMLEALAAAFEVRATDMDPDNIGKVRSGVAIEGIKATGDILGWCDAALVTGTTVVNGTLGKFIGLEKITVFFGVSISAAAVLLGLNRYCPCGL